MRIQSIKLTNFRRFTDLSINGIQQSAKLVLVVGPNGCGKSSIFDALLHFYRLSTTNSVDDDLSYYQKKNVDDFDWRQTVMVKMFGGAKFTTGSIYVRTAYRNDPDFSVTGINGTSSPTGSPRFNKLIENDRTVSENYHGLVYDTMAAVYDPANDSKTVRALREELIGEIRASMRRVFGDIILKDISDPLGTGAFYFEKGASTNYHYKNLSGGEKSGFDILLDLHIKKKYHADTVYCIDEVEAHLHTKIQGALVREIFNVVPETSQLWITTHSLGVLRAAQELEASAPGTVCIIDFDGINADEPSKIFPSSLGRLAWDKMLSIAIDDLKSRVAPEIVIVCEGSTIGNRRKNFDAEIYNRIFGRYVPGVLFVSGGSSNEVATSRMNIGKMLDQVLLDTKVIALADRDDRSEEEIKEWEREGNIILSERNIESYLLKDEVLCRLAASLNKTDMIPSILDAKRIALEASISRGNPPDDLKSAAGQIYTQLKSILNLQRSGNNTDAFLRDTLAPLVDRDMDCYSRLKKCIIDKLYSSVPALVTGA